MSISSEGLTQIYNRFHNAKSSRTISRAFAPLQVEMDKAVAAAYGWSDLNLNMSSERHLSAYVSRFQI